MINLKINPLSFGKLLRDIRDEKRISLRSLAGSAGMDPAYLSRLENGKTGAPKQETVERLALALCEEQQLAKSDCDGLIRRLLVSAGLLQNREELIDDLAERFSARLRDEGFPEDKIDEALSRVPLPTMRKVLLGEEKLEIGFWSETSSEQVQSRRDAGEEVVMFDLPPTANETISETQALNVRETASSYLDRHADDFATHRRRQQSASSQGPQKIIRAGRVAEIRVHQPISKDQEQQLRLIAKLITTILEEKKA